MRQLLKMRRCASEPAAAGLCSTPGTQDAMHPCPWLLPCAAPPALRMLCIRARGCGPVQHPPALRMLCIRARGCGLVQHPPALRMLRIRARGCGPVQHPRALRTLRVRARGCWVVQHPRHSGCYASVPVAAALCSTPGTQNASRSSFRAGRDASRLGHPV